MVNVSKKYLDLLSTGKELFKRFGIKRVTVEEICSEAGVSKMTFYKYFNNKDQLALAIFKPIIEKKTKEFTDLMDSNISFSMKVEQTIMMKMEEGENLSKEFLSEVYSGDSPELLAYLDKKTKENLELMENYYRKAQEKGDLRKDMKIEFLMYFIDHLFVMISDEKLSGMYDTGGELIYEMINFFFYGILPRPEH